MTEPNEPFGAAREDEPPPMPTQPATGPRPEPEPQGPAYGPREPPAASPVPRPRRADRALVATAVLAVVVLLAALGILLGTRQSGAPSSTGSTPAASITGGGRASSGPSSGPAATSHASAAPSSTTAPPAGPPGTASLDATVTAIEAQVPPIRGLQPKADVPTRVIDEAQLRADLTREFDAQNPPGEVAAQEALLEHLGFAPAGTDLRALLLDAQGSDVLGYYDDQTKQMTVVQRGAFGPIGEITIAHEYTHALQDQDLGLKSLAIDDPSNGDRSIARRALVEGDATLLMTLWATQHISPDQLMQALSAAANDPAANAALAKLPPLLREQMTFPYESGLSFVMQTYLAGGWQAVDALYRDPPDSSAQLLHPEKYRAREKPVSVTLPDIARRLGAGWKEQTTDTLGELSLRVWLEQGVAQAEAESVAAGWAGDRVGSYAGPDGTWAVAWEIATGSADAASSLRETATIVAGPLGSSRVVAVPGSDRIRVLVASDPATLARLEAAAGS